MIIFREIALEEFQLIMLGLMIVVVFAGCC